MSAAQRRKGNRAEVALAKWLREHGWPEARTTRDARGGSQGGADICGVPGWAIEVKSVATADPLKWMAQAERQAGVDETPLVIWKPTRRAVADPGRWITARRVTWPTRGPCDVRLVCPSTDLDAALCAVLPVDGLALWDDLAFIEVAWWAREALG